MHFPSNSQDYKTYTPTRKTRFVHWHLQQQKGSQILSTFSLALDKFHSFQKLKPQKFSFILFPVEQFHLKHCYFSISIYKANFFPKKQLFFVSILYRLRVLAYGLLRDQYNLGILCCFAQIYIYFSVSNNCVLLFLGLGFLSFLFWNQGFHHLFGRKLSVFE